MNAVLIRIARLLLLALVSLLVLGAYVQRGTNGYDRAMFSEMVHGTAYRPYVTRALVPVIIRTVSACVPQATRQRVSQAVSDRLAPTERDKWLQNGTIDATEFIVGLVVFYLSIIGFAYGVAALARTFYVLSPSADTVLSAVAAAGLPCFFVYYNHIYDLTHVCLFTWCLVLLARKQWWPYLLVFSLTTVGKETSILLILVFILTARSSIVRTRWLVWLIAQIVVFVVVRGLISHHFMANPGGTVEIHLRHNLSLSPYSISQFVALLAVGSAVALRWREKPVFLRRALFIGVPLLALTFVFGFLDEYRDYYEVYPIVLLLVAHVLAPMFGSDGFRVRAPMNHEEVGS